MICPVMCYRNMQVVVEVQMTSLVTCCNMQVVVVQMARLELEMLHQLK